MERHRHRRTVLLSTVAAVFALVAMLGMVVGRSPSARAAVVDVAIESPKPVVLVYGDSLAWEAKDDMERLLGPDFVVHLATFGGTAICDYTADILRDVQFLQARMVVLAFSGNSLTTCMLPPSGTRDDNAWIETKYQRDVEFLISQLGARGISMTLVGAPPRLDRILDGVPIIRPATWTIGAIPTNLRSVQPNVNAVYETAAVRARSNGYDVGYVDGGRWLKAPGGTWTKVEECQLFDPPSSCDGGLVAVRSYDLVHFCPEVLTAIDGVVVPCEVYSGGAFRYAATIDLFVRNRILTSAPPVSGGTSATDWTIDVEGLTVPIVGMVPCIVESP